VNRQEKSTRWSSEGRHIRTFTGRLIDPCAPDPAKIHIDDIAHALSLACRFLGHTDCFYSVAQHSVLVSELVPPPDALWGLLHDAAEAYLCDLPAPIKQAPGMWFYRSAEALLGRAVACRFGLPPEMPESVKLADRAVLATEFRDVTTAGETAWIVAECGCEPLENIHILRWPPAVAEDRFLRRFWELTK
jgi:hypothetical protein